VSISVYHTTWGKAIKPEPLREYLSANIKARREALGFSQEKLAELADVSVQMIKQIEGRRTWVSDKMLSTLAHVLGITAFKLLAPLSKESSQSDIAAIASLLNTLKQNIHDDIDNRFNRLLR